MPLSRRDRPATRGSSGPPGLLGHRLAVGADAMQVADTVAAVWRDIDRALHPVIGHRGVRALYHRSLKLAAACHPWLADGRPGALAAIDASALHAALARRPTAEALAAGQALLAGSRDVLSSLIGASLTDRLLGSVWGHAPEAPAQDKTP